MTLIPLLQVASQGSNQHGIFYRFAIKQLWEIKVDISFGAGLATATQYLLSVNSIRSFYFRFYFLFNFISSLFGCCIHSRNAKNVWPIAFSRHIFAPFDGERTYIQTYTYIYTSDFLLFAEYDVIYNLYVSSVVRLFGCSACRCVYYEYSKWYCIAVSALRLYLRYDMIDTPVCVRIYTEGGLRGQWKVLRLWYRNRAKCVCFWQFIFKLRAMHIIFFGEIDTHNVFICHFYIRNSFGRCAGFSVSHDNVNQNYM